MKKNKVYKTPLSKEFARKCEEARGGICHCRCGGRFHGRGAAKAQSLSGGLPIDYYNKELSEDDPHWLPTDEQKKERRQQQQEERKIKNKLKTVEKWHRECSKFEPVLILDENAKQMVQYYHAHCSYYRCETCGKIENIYK